MKKAKDEFTDQEGEISRLNITLRDKSNEANDLHREMDKQNAMIVNQKLIEALIELEKIRDGSQDALENGLKGWSAKLKLFEDEIARQSRETAKQKMLIEIEEILEKLRKNSAYLNELEQSKDELETKLYVDGNLDNVTESQKKEVEQINLKIRWANDERKNLLQDLESILKMIEEKNAFIQAQKADLEELAN